MPDLIHETESIDFAFILTLYYPYDSVLAYSFCSQIIDCLEGMGMYCIGVMVGNFTGKVRPREKHKHWFMIRGSNHMAEFSAYQEGLNFLLSMGKLKKDCKVVFVNDTIAAHRSFRNGSPDLIATHIAAPSSGITGFVESGGYKNFSVGNIALTQWVSSFFLSISINDLAKLGFQVFDPIVQNLFTVSDDKIEFSPVISLALQQHIQTWLTSPGRWYGAKPLTKWNRYALRLKVSCILLEKILTAKCVASEIVINPLPLNLFSY